MHSASMVICTYGLFAIKYYLIGLCSNSTFKCFEAGVTIPAVHASWRAILRHKPESVLGHHDQITVL